ncbi:MAG: SLC13 family permease [Gammaproteobacteria bacterium]|nr:SLC13 family permease [Gammaproteobacteria bacterium]
MDWQGWFTTSLAAGALLTLIFTKLQVDFVMMAVMTILMLSGILDTTDALLGFSNAGVITVAAMFVLAAGIQGSGGIDLIVRHVLGRPATHSGAMFRLAAPLLPLSAFINNTPVVSTMIPAVLRWSKLIDQTPSQLMMPLSFFSILGGTCTLVGTSTNLVVDSQYQKLTGEPGFGLFDISLVGIPVALAGALTMMLFFRWLLPRRESTETILGNRKDFTFEVAVATDGPLVGMTIEGAGLRHLRRIFLAEIERRGTILTAVTPDEVLQSGDRLVFVGETDAIIDLLRTNGLVASENTDPVIERNVPERRIVEAVVSLDCEAVGTSIRDSEFRDRYGAVVLAVARDGRHIKGNLGSIILKAGDVLLLEARPAFISRQRYLRDFLVINDLNEVAPDHSTSWLCWLILLGVILSAGIGFLSMLNAALIGAGLMIATRCCTMAEARRSIDLSVILTIGASFALGTALEKTGASEYLAHGIMGFAGSDPMIILLLVYVSVMLLTEMISNNAAALLMLPIVLAMTATLGLNPIPYTMAVTMAASACFLTPIGYQCNLMVQGPGGYHFTDYFKPGIVMTVVCCAVTVLIIPMIWPLQAA